MHVYIQTTIQTYIQQTYIHTNLQTYLKYRKGEREHRERLNTREGGQKEGGSLEWEKAVLQAGMTLFMHARIYVCVYESLCMCVRISVWLSWCVFAESARYRCAEYESRVTRPNPVAEYVPKWFIHKNVSTLFQDPCSRTLFQGPWQCASFAGCCLKTVINLKSFSQRAWLWFFVEWVTAIDWCCFYYFVRRIKKERTKQRVANATTTLFLNF